MRGVPGASRDIYQKLQKNKPVENKPQQLVSNQAVQESISQSLGSGFEGGAAASLQRRRYEQRQTNYQPEIPNESVGIRKRSVAEETQPVQKTKVDVSDYLSAFFDQLQTETDAVKITRTLFNLYLTGDLPEYEVEGLVKSEILKVIDDCRKVVDGVVM